MCFDTFLYNYIPTVWVVVWVVLWVVVWVVLWVVLSLFLFFTQSVPHFLDSIKRR